MLAEGHSEAQDYPIGRVWDEFEIVSSRVRYARSEEAVLTQLAISSVLSTKSQTAFKKAIKELRKD